MKKTFSMLFLFVLLFAFYQIGSTYQLSTISATELFGDGDLHMISIRSISLGIIHAWGSWLYLEYRPAQTHGQCLLIPLQDVLNDSVPVYCEKFYQPAGKYFQGFIYFRGHERKFCGGNFIPRACLKIGEVTHG